ncbi:winged helix-turn-helix domain-containing protein [Candidatus Woesearchaeota archaeon]|nr:winged helix-turn-helix domain-containing protein [Candidatus Woesearchaeota archaeon]
MKKIEFVYREILYQLLEKKNNKLTQLAVASKLNISLSTVNYALKPLRAMGAVDVKLKNFTVVDKQKIIYYWASLRNISKDIIYETRVDKPIQKIESEMPANVVYGAFTAYKFKFKDVPADYSEIYVYGSDEIIDDIKKRFPESKNVPNLFVLKKDSLMENYGQITTLAQTFVDLWNLKEWYAKEFLMALEEKISNLMK